MTVKNVDEKIAWIQGDGAIWEEDSVLVLGIREGQKRLHTVPSYMPGGVGFPARL